MATKLKERASAIKAAGSIFVFAATDRSVPKKSAVLKASYAEHTCGDCGTMVKASAETPQPFCVTCGSHHVKATGSAVKTEIDKTTLVSVRCGKCSSANILSKPVLAAASNHVHCINCGHDMVAAAEAPPALDVPKLDSPNVSQKPLGVPDIESFKIDTPVDEPFEHDLPVKKTEATTEEPLPAVLKNGTTEPELREPEPADDSGVDNPKGIDVEKADAESFDFSAPADDDIGLDEVETSSWDFGPDEIKEGETAADDLSLLEGKEEVHSSEEFTEEDDGEMFDPSADDETADALMDNLDMDDTCAQVAFVSAGSKLVAMKGTVTIATLSPKDAGKNADLLHSDVMASAIIRQAEQAGLRKGLASMGFKLIRIKSSSKIVTDKKVQAKVAEIAKASAQRESETAECLALAAAGLARNFWRDKPNPMKTAFEKELAHLGVSNPQVVSASLFKTYGVEYTKSLVEIANSIQALGAENRKTFAAALDMTDGIDPAFDIATGSNVDDMPMNDYSEVEDVQARLSRPATVTAALLRPSSTRVSASTYDRAHAILNGTARLNLGV